MYAGRIVCCHLLSHGKYADGTDRRKDAGPLRSPLDAASEIRTWNSVRKMLQNAQYGQQTADKGSECRFLPISCRHPLQIIPMSPSYCREQMATVTVLLGNGLKRADLQFHQRIIIITPPVKITVTEIQMPLSMVLVLSTVIHRELTGFISLTQTQPQTKLTDCYRPYSPSPRHL